MCTENKWQPDALKSRTSKENGLSNNICAFCYGISITWLSNSTTISKEIQNLNVNARFEHTPPSLWFLCSIAGQTLMRSSNKNCEYF